MLIDKIYKNINLQKYAIFNYLNYKDLNIIFKLKKKKNIKKVYMKNLLVYKFNLLQFENNLIKLVKTKFLKKKVVNNIFLNNNNFNIYSQNYNFIDILYCINKIKYYLYKLEFFVFDIYNCRDILYILSRFKDPENNNIFENWKPISTPSIQQRGITLIETNRSHIILKYNEYIDIDNNNDEIDI